MKKVKLILIAIVLIVGGTVGFLYLKNEYNKKYWKIPSFTWIPSVPLVEGNRMYCFIVQGIWEKEGIPRITIRNYVYMKEN